MIIILFSLAALINIFLKPKKKKRNYKKQSNFKRKQSNYTDIDFYNSMKKKNKSTINKKENKEKGDLYEKFISKHFKKQGYTIAEHGIDNGVKDNGIDIIAKKEKEILFIQCKNWSAKSNNKVRDKELKVTRQDVQDYMNKHPMYEMGDYNTKIIYIMSENVLHGSAYHYIKEHNDKIKFQIIPML